ncbi:hypothetical protein BW723_07620 [Polaribacter reichenbachii]|uniref:Cardiolipin synthase N-terminal domain-containing protein n=1 Tax=Polaribacter reichenbachii TaxID=996801 RepID=A0A1B8U6G6_9FLAO|nr:hypothetical protein BW723_07620 [Polaribacter reichenbachii]AUC20035.1 hypothetical protein BTO17_15640 [Polaribacter reichenbachii]OBY67418.1 hypothetical protein LPB301_01870 [Polaribacter reichenbachii]
MKTPLIIALIVLSLTLWFKAISDISRTRFTSDKNKKVWFFIIFFIPVFGASTYFLMKKKYIKKRPKY